MAKVYVYKNCNDIVAHLPGVIGAVARVANERAAVARGTLLAHYAEGYSSIDVSYGDVDAFVNLVDRPSVSNRGRPVAHVIEFGGRNRKAIAPLRKAFGLSVN